MKYHHSPTHDQWLQCRAWRKACPFGADADKTIEQIVVEAALNHQQGKPLPVLKDTAGNERRFSFGDDGSYSFGARTYDRHGVLVPSERTVKAWRLKELHIADSVRDFAAFTEELKIQFMGPTLIKHEIERGVLASRESEEVRFTDWRDYTREHHRGLFGWFFKSEWTQTSKDDSLSSRYRQTLEAMFGKVWSWVRGRRQTA